MAQPDLPTFISRQVRDGRYWFLDLQPDGPALTTAVCGGYETVASDYDVHRSGFTFRTVELVVAGSGVVELGERSFALTSGMSYAYGPTVPHRIRTDPRRPLGKYFLCFAGQAAERLLNSGALVDGSPVWVSDISNLITLLDLIQDNSRGGANAAPICNRLVEVFLLKLADLGQVADGRPDRGAAETFHAVRRYLRNEFLTVDSIEKVANQFGISPAYLARLFRRFEKTTPHDYLNRLKMTHAASVLLSTNCRVKDVADQLGYSDPFHFSRAFKAEFGVSPRAFVARVRSA